MTYKTDLKELRKELIEAHLEYDKKLNNIWVKLNKMIKDSLTAEEVK
jgi:hypothetical protein